MNKILILLAAFYICIFPQSPIPANAKPEKIATGFKFVEGPVWVDSLGLLFSDIEGNTIYKLSPADNKVTPFLQPSDSSNGLSLDNQGRLVLTQMRLRRISRMTNDGAIIPIVSEFRGKKFNSPNDLAIKSDGSIFFTDPDFNIPYPYDNQLGFQGIYRIGPRGNITLLDSVFDKPNGICFSPDEKILYVNESPKCLIYAWDVTNDSTLTNKRLFCDLKVQGYADGMKTDSAGNIYCTGPGGVFIISPEGKLLDKITLTESARNCNWGDADRKTLYITAGKSIYKIRIASTTGIEDNERYAAVDKSYHLYPCYPNPFNPSAHIKYSVSKTGFVDIRIFDILGKEIITLVNQEKAPGEYQVDFISSGLPNGTYFCRMTIDNFSETQKIVLLK